ncbi:MAG: YfjI family protein [Tepidimonas taiwanensis]|nr:YfjI family protein [Tepidimonas taiwanensis]
MRSASLPDAIAAARSALAALDPPPPPYPLEALGPLAEAADALSRGAQVHPALAGQAMLVAASHLVSAVWAGVRTPAGVAVPPSLYGLSVAPSGSGKSLAEGVAAARLRAWQAQAGEAHARACRAAAREGRPPAAPPWRLCADATLEGLHAALAEGAPAQLLLAPEGGMLLGGWGMAAERRLRMAAGLCALWDGAGLSSLRRGSRLERSGVRLSLHLLLQPEAAREALADRLLAGVGLWPRTLLVVLPPPEPRRLAPWRADDDPAIVAFWARCDDLLAQPLPRSCDALPVLEVEPAALQRLGALLEDLETEALDGGRLGGPLRPFALRATELATRVAAVLAAWEGAPVVAERHAAGGEALALHSLEHWARTVGRGDAGGTHAALALYSWLLERGGRAQLRAVVREGPRALRSAAARDVAVAQLEAAGLVARAGVEVVVLDTSPSVASLSPPRGDTKHQKNQRFTQSVAAVAGGEEDIV